MLKNKGTKKNKKINKNSYQSPGRDEGATNDELMLPLPLTSHPPTQPPTQPPTLQPPIPERRSFIEGGRRGWGGWEEKGAWPAGSKNRVRLSRMMDGR